MNTAKIIGITQPFITRETQPDDPLMFLTADELIAYVARVSNPDNQMNTETSDRLLKYLVRNHHWSPFEMVSIVMEINTTRDIARQILRHRSFSFQEFSQRYADPTQSLGFSTREARLQDTKNRQNSIETDDSQLEREWDQVQEALIEYTQATYNWAVNRGIAKEQARAVLPEGITNSRMYMNGTLRSWIHYCQLRCANGTQKEHREVALSAWDGIISYFPSLEGLINDQ